MRIETRRLYLRPFDDKDIDIIMQLYSDKEIMKYMPSPVMDHKMALLQLNQNHQAFRNPRNTPPPFPATS